MKHIKGDAIEYTFDDTYSRILLHVCNAQGVMGSGIAKQVKDKIPSAYQNYVDSGYKLGSVSYDEDYIVCSLVAQDKFGYDGRRYIDYGMLAKTLAQVAHENPFDFYEFVIPYGMGSDRAGGDWRIVLEICCGFLGEDKITVVEYGKGFNYSPTYRST